MEQKKKFDLHLILKYGRPLICFLLVVSFIFIYSINSFAQSVNFLTWFNITETPVTPLFYDSMINAYVANGGNSNNLTLNTSSGITTGNLFRNGHGNITSSGFNSYIANQNIDDTYTYNGVTYDLTNAYTFVVSQMMGDGTSSNLGRTWSEGNIAIIGAYIVSDSPIYQYYQGISSSWAQLQVTNTLSANGYYCTLLGMSPANNDFRFVFSDLSIYYPSSDGSTGFTTFSLDSTDFVFGSSNNYDFNFLKTGGNIVAPGDPEPIEPEPEYIGQYYTYCGMDAYFSSGNAESVLLNYTVSPNEYMRLHPSEYDVMIDVSAVIVTTGTDHPNIPLTYSNSYTQGLETYINSASNPNLQIWFDDLVNANSNNSLADALKGWWSAVTNADQQYYNVNGSVISFGGASASGGTRSLGGYSLNPNLKISDIVFQCSLRVEYNKTDPRQVSGVYRFQQGLISGSRSQLENTIATNFNVPESYNPQYPAPITDSQGNIVVGSGGTNLTVNPVTYNNLNAIVEYLYHIDAQEFLALAGNNQNAIQYALNTLSSTDSNGFFPVLTRTFAIIPDQIWDWIKVSFAVILGGAILGIAYRMVRWR